MTTLPSLFTVTVGVALRPEEGRGSQRGVAPAREERGMPLDEETAVDMEMHG